MPRSATGPRRIATLPDVAPSHEGHVIGDKIGQSRQHVTTDHKRIGTPNVVRKLDGFF